MRWTDAHACARMQTRRDDGGACRGSEEEEVMRAIGTRATLSSMYVRAHHQRCDNFSLISHSHHARAAISIIPSIRLPTNDDVCVRRYVPMAVYTLINDDMNRALGWPDAPTRLLLNRFCDPSQWQIQKLARG